MNEPATYDENNWCDLAQADKKALKIIPRYSADYYEIIAEMAGPGQPSMDALVAKELAVEGEPHKVHGRRVKLTDNGWLAFEWSSGRRTRVYPRASS